MLRIAPLLAAAALAGCAVVVPRFSQDVATSFARDDMRKLETESLELYYPAQEAEQARAIAARLEYCVQRLRASALRPPEHQRLLGYITTANFNNAYVQPPIAGHEQQMVLPTGLSVETFDFFGLGLRDVGDVACHEAMHYVQFEQMDSGWKLLNDLIGPSFSPQIFTEPWFIEGTATWYEGALGRRIGRPHSPLWRGAFQAGFEAEGRDPGAGLLDPNQRKASSYGAQYLTGWAFVDWLATTRGPEKLWRVIQRQGGSVAPPIAFTLRFKSVYGKSIGAMFDEFVAATRAQLPKRVRPAGQRTLAPDLGYAVRMAAARDGAIAVVTAGLDRPSRLTVFEADGRQRFSRRLTQILPFRDWIATGPGSVSGMAFSADGRKLYFMAADVDTNLAFVTQLREYDASNGDLLRRWTELDGAGGCLSADGGSYVFVRAVSGSAQLARLRLDTGAVEALTGFEPHTSVASPACSPDGRRIAFSQRGPDGFDLWLREEDGSLVALTSDGRFNYGARWLDERRLVFIREQEGRSQAHVIELDGRAITPASDAPWAVLDAAPAGGGRIAFLNRDGWGWSLDVVEAVEGPTSKVERGAEQAAAEDAAAPPAAAPTPATEPAEAVAALKIESDERYSQLDRLFVPTLRVPFGFSFVDPDTDEARAVVGASLLGGDRLGFHNWGLNVVYDTADTVPSVSAQYGNYLLAPWYLELSGALVRLGPVYDKQLALTASRAFWTTPVALGLTAIDHFDVSNRGVVRDRDRLIGPSAATAWFAGEDTPYGGITRGLGFSARARAFPKGMGSDFDLGDLRGELAAFVPLPISRRHSLGLGLRGRGLVGRSGAGRLEVGGINELGLVTTGASTSRWQRARAADLIVLPPSSMSFTEPVRGYEDLEIDATATAIASASYVIPLVIDRGWASFLYVLPSFFVRQIDLEAFGEGASVWSPAETGGHRRDLLRAAGGALHLRMGMSGAPFSIVFQGAHRFDVNQDRWLFVGGFALQ